MPLGQTVDEVFGLPPLLPLRVRWICDRFQPPSDQAADGSLVFSSAEGLEGVATACFMRFALNGDGQGGTELELEMEYEPVSALANIAAPVLVIDNAIALKVLLPRELARVRRRERPLGTMDPIAGPLVAASRRLGLLPKEEDGWTGEPTAWAKADSIPQKLSELSQTRLPGIKQWVADLAAGDFDREAVDVRLDGLIGSSAVVMFSFTNCPFCKGAKELLDAKGVGYAVIELDQDTGGAALRSRLGARTSRTSVPSVWIDGECIGGLNDGPGLVQLDANGMLEPKLRAAGALV